MNIQYPEIVVRHIRTKNKTRKIVTYCSNDCELRKRHEKINNFLQERFVPSIFAKGYVKRRSIYQNTLSHMYNDYFIMLDIKDFFPHICHKQLIEKIYKEINLKSSNQITKKGCKEIVDICSVSSRGIPLGFITSPILSNIYLKEFDNVFYGKLKQMRLNNIIYTRYADDITVSFKYDQKDKNIEIENQIIDAASAILTRLGLQINKKKTRSFNLNISNHVRITGVNIIKKGEIRRLTVGRTIKKQLYWDAIKCLQEKETSQIQYVKGMQSYILSIEKQGYESCYSKAMMDRLYTLGYESLKSLIDSL